jgi:hypothetical protein
MEREEKCASYKQDIRRSEDESTASSYTQEVETYQSEKNADPGEERCFLSYEDTYYGNQHYIKRCHETCFSCGSIQHSYVLEITCAAEDDTCYDSVSDGILCSGYRLAGFGGNLVSY